MTKRFKTKKDFSAGGVVWDGAQKRLLLVQVENLSKKKVWTFPKGHPEPGESDEEAALREVWEETGWKCEIVKSLRDVRYFYIHRNVRTHKTVRWFLMSPVEKTCDFDPVEILQCLWCSLEEAEEKTVYATDKEILKMLKDCL